MKIEIQTFPSTEWADIVGHFSDLNLLQTWEYVEAQVPTSLRRLERGLIYDNNHTIGAFQAIIKYLPIAGCGVVWINRGPLWRPMDGPGTQKFDEILQLLHEHYVTERRVYLRLAPPVIGVDLKDLDMGKFRQTTTPGWASAIVDLSKPIDELRRSFEQKWRNCLNKSERSGVTLGGEEPQAQFDLFLARHQAFIDQRGYTTSVTPALLAAIQSRLPEDRKMRTILAMKDGDCIGSALIACYGETCEYLAGNSTDAGRKFYAGQFLIWQAMQMMKDLGYRRFDVGGMDPVLTPPGIYRFKRGIGGEPYQLAPEIESIGGGLRARLIGGVVRRYRNRL